MSVAQLEVALDRPLPQSPDAERAVLGSILINNLAFFRVADLTERDFFRDAHRIIFRAIEAILIGLREECDIITLRHQLTKTGDLEAVGGTAYIASLVDGIPDIANIERYAHFVKEKARQRALIVLGNKIMRAASDHDADADAIVADAMAALGPQATKQDNQAVPLHEALGRAHGLQEELARSGGSIALRCGIFPTLDKLKFFSRTLVAIKAPSKHAKSGMMVELANGFADQGQAAAMFSLEDNEHELALRHSSAQTGIGHSMMRDWADWREYHPDYYSKVAECRADASRKNIFLADNLHLVEEITLEMRRLKAMHSIDVVLIDYIQEVQTRMRIQNREERLAEICRLLRKTAVELGVCCVVLSQIDEVTWEKRGYGPLHMSDFAHAKLIGKIARGTLAFHRPRKVNPDDPNPICFALMQVIANNNERTHEGFKGHFDEETQRWGEGDCAANNCWSLRDGPVQQKLSA